ncbi:MAG: RNA-guided endonuclease IscB, partial [Oscillospiraceae bacterium]|nr:RNA-guided endonuclease IscB [Oscillospiraceae bacterium]
MVYVLAQDGTPLMPTKRHGKVRRLLDDGKAKVVKRTPFTIQLLYPSTKYVQPISLGVDAGSKHIGFSATTETEELYASEVEIRNDMVKKLAAKREFRKVRRNRKTRHRKVRFQNRAKPKNWLAPSVQQKIQTHIQVIQNVTSILPISKIIVETASFDIQKIKNPKISGKEYQQG